jgi:pSer/pThr/pTyr-binding forkhead associated (FHA) protein
MASPPRSGLFRRHCGSRAALAIDVEREGQAGARRHVLSAPFALLGRDERNQVCLPDGDVSRRHAYLQVIAGGVFWADLGSRTGVRCNGEERRAGWLAAGDRLQVGPFTLRLAGPAADWPVPGGDFDPLAADPAAAAPAWALELPGGLRWRVNRALTLVGTSSRCKLRPKTGEASRFHCSLLRAPEGVWAVDLLSRHGTHVNGERVPWALLEEGDELGVGRVALRLRREVADAPGVSVALGEGEGTASLSPAEPEPPSPAGGEGAPGEAPPPLDYPLLARPPATRPAGLVSAGPRPPVAYPPELQEALLGPVISQFSLMQQQMLEQFHQTMMMMAQMFGNLHRDQMTLIREELKQLQRVTQELQTLHVELAARTAEGPGGQGEPPPARPGAADVAAPQAGPAATRQPAATPPPGEPRPAAAPPGPESPERIHALLRQRLASLEAERKSRWDRVLHFMLGK